MRTLVELRLLGVLRQASARGWVSHQELFGQAPGDSETIGSALEKLLEEGLVRRVDDHLFRFALARDVPESRLRLSALAALSG